MMVVLGSSALVGVRRDEPTKIGGVDGINLGSIVIATLGAIAVIFVASLVTGSRGLRRGQG